MRSALLLLLLVSAAVAGERDWFTRVADQGLAAASREDALRHGRGVLGDSLHVGECYGRLGRWAEALAVYARLTRSPDRNYAAAALARAGEARYHLGDAAAARETFTRCLEEHPAAWLDESIPDFCRAWLAKLDGSLPTPPAAEPDQDLEGLRGEVRELTDRLEELKRLIRELMERNR